MAVFIYGASGHAKVVIETLEKQGEDIAGLIDDDPKTAELLGYRVTKALGELNNRDNWIIAVGNNLIRKRISMRIVSSSFAKVIDPSANISPRSTIGEGSVIFSGVCVNSSSDIGKHVILNTNCSVDHDCLLGDFVHISPNVALAGNVCVGEGTHIGIGACIIQGVSIGKWATVGAGAVIIENIPDYAVVVGVPGKVIKYNKNEY